MQALSLLRPGTHTKAHEEDARDKEEGIVLFMGERQFDRDEGDEGEAKEQPLPSGQTERAIEGTRTKIERNRPHHADGVQSRERIEIRRADEHDRGQDDGDDERDQRHAMAVQFRELPRHFTVARHHVKDADHGDHRGIRSAEQEQEKEDADGPTRACPKRGETVTSPKYSATRRSISAVMRLELFRHLTRD